MQPSSREKDQSVSESVAFDSADEDVIFLDPEEIIAVETNPDASTVDEISDEDDEDVDPSEKRFEKITSEVESVSGYVVKKKEETRGILAITYVRATFLMFILVFMVSIFDGVKNQNSIVANLEKLLPIISGIFLGTLGFVIGYYFRKDEQ